MRKKINLMYSLIHHRLRRDALPILLFVFVYVAMTYPLILRVGETLPFLNADTYRAVWQNWWTWGAFKQGIDINHTPLLFAPFGLDHTTLPPRYPAMLVWVPLYELFGEPTAYNVSVSIQILMKAYGMYLLGLWLFKNRIAAWVSGAFYAFGAVSLQLALQQPLTGSTEWIPFFMLAFLYGIDQIKQQKALQKIVVMMLIAAVLFSLNVYMNVKIGIFAMLLGGGYVLGASLWYGLWRDVKFWSGMVVFAVAVLLVSAPLLMPMITSSDFANAVDTKTDFTPIDIMNFLKRGEKHPVLYTNVVAKVFGHTGTPYYPIDFFRIPTVGIVSIAFAMSGVWYGIRKDRRALIFAVLTVIFWVLSLGDEWVFNGQVISSWTPYDLLKDNFLIVILRYSFRFVLLFWFVYAVLIGYGLQGRLQYMRWTRWQVGSLVMSVVMLLYGTSVMPIPLRPSIDMSYTDFLNQQPDGAVIDLPLGRQPSKYYMAIQRDHGRPMIEGMMARTPADAYDYIDSVAVFDMLDGDLMPDSAEESNTIWQESMQQLMDDGFRYVILHRYYFDRYQRDTSDAYLQQFEHFPSVYEDEHVLIYDIETLVTLPFKLSD